MIEAVAAIVISRSALTTLRVRTTRWSECPTLSCASTTSKERPVGE